ncbi:hypothetical protein GF354_04080 [Candidatus Peregrinibacteria bacterium]|nr:hypothetical protein [Candidatus Peregrinibacteria bacterium]
MEFKNVKIVVYVPVSHSDKIRDVLAKNEAGHIGNYDYCSFSCIGTGRFRGLEGSNPSIGQKGKIEEVKEERIETICEFSKLDKVLKALNNAHPYEEPAIDVFPLLN